MTTIVSTPRICSRQSFAGNNDMPPVLHTYLQFLRCSLFRKYIRTCASLQTVERSESSAANRPVGRESGHNPIESKESPQVSWEARDEACFETNSNTSYNKNKNQFRIILFKYNSSGNSLVTCIYYEIITNQMFYKHYITYMIKVPKHPNHK